MQLSLYIAYYLLGMNVVTFILYGIDKGIAHRNGKSKQQNHSRLSEATLIGAALLGGALGAVVAMCIFHHKTLHKKFTILLPLILLAQIIGLIWWSFT